ncbi:response regulator transcription factor [Cohnella yongneupensis]|uniref:Response regulator n=1 Tax=Cohnella yongneupensis TaxID=425006 RepID=A0ABW0R388_9BACL
MLKLIIADDETKVRNGLMNVIPWQDYGIQVVGDADNGAKALELCRQLEPDILFTDIRMPIMDGLQTAQKLKEAGSRTKVILISGIEDFTFAKTALSLNVTNYILKPVKIDELKEIIRQTVETIHLENYQEMNIRKIKLQLQENMPIVKKDFFQNLIVGKYTKIHELAEKLIFLEIPLVMDDSALTAVFQVDDYDQTKWANSEEERQLLKFSIMNIIDEIMGNYDAGIFFSPGQNEFVVIFNGETIRENKYGEICEEIINCINKYLNVMCSAGIGSPVLCLNKVSSSYSDALTALQFKFYTGSNSILNIGDLNKMMLSNDAVTPGYNHLYLTENELISSIKLGNLASTKQLTDNLFEMFNTQKKHTVEYVQSVCVEFLFIALRSAYESGDDFNKIGLNQKDIIERINAFGNIHSLKNYMNDVLIRMADYYAQKYNSNKSSAVNKIQDIVKRRYGEELSLAIISEEVHFTPSYISQIFKQETGTTLIEFITTTRVEKARELLKNTDHMISEIATMVGFENPHYFSSVFKKYVGVRPNDFRAEAR